MTNIFNFFIDGAHPQSIGYMIRLGLMAVCLIKVFSMLAIITMALDPIGF
jgi:hypothetical protein